MPLSVIVPTYKSPDTLDLCLKSLIENQVEKNQIIVVVDGHHNLNKTILETHAEHIEILNLEHNVGTCRAINLGVYNARHSNVLIMNDDNIACRKWDEALLDAQIQQPYVITPNQIEPTPSIFPQFNIKNLGRDPKTFDLNAFYDYADSVNHNKVEESGSTFPFMMYKYNFIKIGGFDESYPSSAGFVADWDFFLKCRMNDLKMMRAYNCHFYHFVSVSSKSPEQIEKAQQDEINCHEYAKYKWGKYIKTHPQNNLKFL
jgi:GT2 family glycosyltransferase